MSGQHRIWVLIVCFWVLLVLSPFLFTTHSESLVSKRIFVLYWFSGLCCFFNIFSVVLINCKRLVRVVWGYIFGYLLFYHLIISNRWQSLILFITFNASFKWLLPFHLLKDVRRLALRYVVQADSGFPPLALPLGYSKPYRPSRRQFSRYCRPMVDFLRVRHPSQYRSLSNARAPISEVFFL